MDTLKENLYGISLVAIVLGLGAMAYFLVVQPIYGSSGATIASRQKFLDNTLSAAKKINKGRVRADARARQSAACDRQHAA